MSTFGLAIRVIVFALIIQVLYNTFINQGDVEIVSQYYNKYRNVDHFLKETAARVEQAKEYLPKAKHFTDTYVLIRKQLIYYSHLLANHLTYGAFNPFIDPDKKTFEEPSYRMSSCGSETKSVRVWTKEELSKFDGHSESDILLGFLGVVYNVSMNGQHYGPGAEYNVFAGKDATRAFVTGNFTHDLNDDITDIEENQFTHIENWAGFYSSSYQEVGRIEGAFFNEFGCPTIHLLDVLMAIDKLNRGLHEQAERDKQFPACNSEWNGQTQEGRVWCSEKSGGVERDWAGIPRLYSEGKEQKCVCVDPELGLDSYNETFSVYPGCDPLATECSLVEYVKLL